LKADDRNPQTGTKHLKHRLEVAVGMKIMVTLNLAMEANLANSSQGIIHDIVLELRESVCEDNCDENSIVWLQYPLAMIIFKPYKYQFNPFPGLEPSLILIFPSKVSFNIHCPQKPKMTIHRQQYPLCTTYAFMDHKAQGQTIKCIIVNIGPTKRFPVDPFATYVAMSHSRGHNTIRLLRDFDKRIFTRHPSTELRSEDERLACLTTQTKAKYEMGAYNFV